MTDNIYEEFGKILDGQALAILHKGEVIGRIVNRYSPSGNSCFAYVHLHGTRMLKGRAGGGGYDRQSAAINRCAEKAYARLEAGESFFGYEKDFWECCAMDDGYGPVHHLRERGFQIVQVL